MTWCFDVTGVVVGCRDELVAGAAALAAGCDDRDRFTVRHGDLVHVLTPGATAALLADGDAGAGADGMRDVAACALGVANEAWLTSTFDHHVLVAPVTDLTHLAWWRSLAASRPGQVAAVHHPAARPAVATVSQPDVGVDTHLALLASLRTVVCVGEGARDELVAVGAAATAVRVVTSVADLLDALVGTPSEDA